MHIQTMMLGGAVCAAATAASTGGLGIAAVKARKAAPVSATEFAGVSALIFAAQMLNFPIAGGTSGHIIGGVLAAALLGTPLGVLAVSLVLAIQAVLFSDGGLLELGANIFNMGLIGAGVGGLLRNALIERKVSSLLATALASWSSVMLASIACSVELVVGNDLSFASVTSAMVGTHALIGIGEALATTAIVALFSSVPQRAGDVRPVGLVFALSFVALMVAPFASTLPDGLESVANQFALLHQGMPSFVTPLSGYEVPMIATGSAGTIIAGVAGVFATATIGWSLLKVTRANRS